jgi:sulfur relay (sulfurtransferase) complex TusBCD TusD component (DsrE family)
MRIISHCCLAFVLLLGGLATPSLAGDGDPLFINLTADDPHRANMAITFGRNQQDRGHPLTIFLNDKAVLIGSKGNAARFSDHQAKLLDVVARGGTVLICPMCMQHYGVKDADLLPGIKVGSPEITGASLFKENSKTLAW